MAAVFSQRDFDIFRAVVESRGSLAAIGRQHGISGNRVHQIVWSMIRRARRDSDSDVVHESYRTGVDLAGLRKDRARWLRAIAEVADRT